jgi:hypothetical protein
VKLTQIGIRDGVHDARLTREENIFLAILWTDHVGEANAIRARELAVIFSQRLNGIHTAGLWSRSERNELKRILELMDSTRSHRQQMDWWKRDVREMHNHLLKSHDHIPILSRAGTGGGYWIAENDAELHAFYDSFRKRGLTGLVKAARGKKAVMADLVNQLAFDFELKDRARSMTPVRSGSGVSLPVQVVDQFLERMLADPERFSGDLMRLSKKFGGVLFSDSEVSVLRDKVRELSELVGV